MTRRAPLAPGLSAASIAHLAEGSSSRSHRLVDVAAQLIAEQGVAAASARAVAAAAGVSASAINYNFGGLERLLSSAFELGRTVTADWLARQKTSLLALPRSPGGAVWAFEHLVRAWTREARPLALLYQEALAAAPGPATAWTGLWRDFWLDCGDAFGLGEIQARLLHAAFESEALYHLSAWSPALEDAALREFAEHVGAVWLDVPAAPPIGALALAEQTARARLAEAASPSALKIMEAAAEVVEGGLGALTHRAVAARAGLTTGAVTHHFRTVEDLVAGAIRGQVIGMNLTAAAADEAAWYRQIASAEAMFAAFRQYDATAEENPGRTQRRGNLFLATVRRPDLAEAGAVIRFAHGGTAAAILGRLFDLSPEVLSLHSGTLSRLLSAVRPASAADASPAESREQLVTAIEQGLLARLAQEPARAKRRRRDASSLSLRF